MNQPPRAVFDCVVYVQALISGRGPAAECVRFARAGTVASFISPAVMAELRDVPLRPALTNRYKHLTPEFVEAFAVDVERHSVLLPNPARTLALPRDPKDEPYLDLAVASSADFLVTWNVKHLTYLMTDDTDEGHEFRRRFPNLTILSPPQFLVLIRAT